jgi:hypothetical protein
MAHNNRIKGDKRYTRARVKTLNANGNAIVERQRISRIAEVCFTIPS